MWGRMESSCGLEGKGSSCGLSMGLVGGMVFGGVLGGCVAGVVMAFMGVGGGFTLDGEYLGAF